MRKSRRLLCAEDASCGSPFCTENCLGRESIPYGRGLGETESTTQESSARQDVSSKVFSESGASSDSGPPCAWRHFRICLSLDRCCAVRTSCTNSLNIQVLFQRLQRARKEVKSQRTISSISTRLVGICRHNCLRQTRRCQREALKLPINTF